MKLERTTCYKAVLAHDVRFDGLFFTCVKSTGIYCRPICRAIVPREENCTFVASPIEAEKAGYRPCLRCRPEHAPARMEQEQDTASRLASYINETLLADESLADVAERFDMSERHLRRLFKDRFGVEPKKYLTTRRLLFAKQLLQDTVMPVAQVAYAAGFGSVGRLTINMQTAYGFTPERLRKQEPATAVSKSLQLRADYRPPFDWQSLLEFIDKRATPLEWVADNAYHRHIAGQEIIVRNVPERNHLTIEIPVESSRQAHKILGRTRVLFDLDANPGVIADVLTTDPLLKTLLAASPGVRVPGCWNKFEMLLRAIIGQQISVRAATTIMRRVAETIGLTPDTIAASTPEEIAALGMPLKRATTIHELGKRVQSGEIDLDESNPELFSEQFAHIAGIGPWTNEYLRLRVLHWPDALPAEDIGLQKAVLPGARTSKKELIRRAEQWRPWRSYAVMLLWNSLNQGG